MINFDGLFSKPIRKTTGTVIAAVFLFPATLAAETVSFAGDVLPILELRCVECHQPAGEGYEKSGLDLRSYKGLMTGTKFGSVVTPRCALTSNLIAVVERKTDKSIWMPHERRQLSKCERRTLRFWISQGARNN